MGLFIPQNIPLKLEGGGPRKMSKMETANIFLVNGITEYIPRQVNGVVDGKVINLLKGRSGLRDWKLLVPTTHIILF